MRHILLLAVFLTVSITSYAEETYRVQVLTKDYVPELGYEYSDAQYIDNVAPSYTLYQIKELHQAEILAEKEKRIAARIEEKNNPTKYVEPSKEMLEADKATLLAQLADLDARIVTAKLKAEMVVEEVIA